MTQGFGVIRMKTIFRAMCVCVNVSESLGKCAHIFLHCSVSIFMCSISHATLPGAPQCA